jgi:hypothetical protein
VARGNGIVEGHLNRAGVGDQGANIVRNPFDEQLLVLPGYGGILLDYGRLLRRCDKERFYIKYRP